MASRSAGGSELAPRSLHPFVDVKNDWVLVKGRNKRAPHAVQRALRIA